MRQLSQNGCAIIDDDSTSDTSARRDIVTAAVDELNSVLILPSPEFPYARLHVSCWFAFINELNEGDRVNQTSGKTTKRNHRLFATIDIAVTIFSFLEKKDIFIATQASRQLLSHRYRHIEFYTHDKKNIQLFHQYTVHKHFDAVIFSYDGQTIFYAYRHVLGQMGSATGENKIEYGNVISNGNSKCIATSDTKKNDIKIAFVTDRGSVVIYFTSPFDHRNRYTHRLETRDAVDSAVYNANGNEIITLSEHGAISIWSANTWRHVKSLRSQTNDRRTNLFKMLSADGRYALFAEPRHSNRLHVLDIEADRVINVLDDHKSDEIIICANIRPDGEKIITATNAGIIKIWDSENTCLHTLDDPYYTRFIAFNDNGTQIISASNVEVRIWDTETGNLVCATEHAFPNTRGLKNLAVKGEQILLLDESGLQKFTFFDVVHERTRTQSDDLPDEWELEWESVSSRSESP